MPLAASHLISCHLISCHLISSHAISSHLMPSHAISSQVHASWIFVYTSATLYTFWWDVCMDWHLGQWRAGGLRERRMFQFKSVYYAASKRRRNAPAQPNPDRTNPNQPNPIQPNPNQRRDRWHSPGGGPHGMLSVRAHLQAHL